MMRSVSSAPALPILAVLGLFAVDVVAEEESPIFPSAYANAVSGAPDERPYWVGFNDPTLRQLVETGLAANYDLKAAMARIAQAEAAARQAKAPLLPSVSAEGAWNLRQFDQVGLGYATPANAAAAAADTPAVLQSVTASLKASYIADITGKGYLNRQAALIDTGVVKTDAASQSAAMAALVANAYYAVAVAKVRLAVAEDQIRTSQEFLDLVEAQFDVGSANGLDVLQQRQQLEAAKSRLPLVRMILETSRQQLAVLLGDAGVSKLPEIAARLPELTPLPATGKPERLLTAKPELRTAALRIRALVLREKSAFRTLLPSLTFSGQVGYQMNYSEEVDHGEIWGLSALLSVPLYQGGSTRAGLDRARASTRAEIGALQQAAFKAVGEVESALIRDKEQQAYVASIERQLEISRVAFEEAKARYTVGLSSYLNVLTALATHQQVQLTQVQAHLDWIGYRIALLHALGGEWTEQLVKP